MREYKAAYVKKAVIAVVPKGKDNFKKKHLPVRPIIACACF
jgi:hypothetical protein